MRQESRETPHRHWPVIVVICGIADKLPHRKVQWVCLKVVWSGQDKGGKWRAGWDLLVCFCRRQYNSGSVALFWVSLPLFPWPWCVPAGKQTAKDSSCQDLMTRVISLWGNVSLGAARPVSPGPHLLHSPGGGGPSPPFPQPPLPSMTDGESRDWNRPLMCKTPPLVYHHCPLCHWGGADEGVE